MKSLTCSKDVLYAVRREELKKLKHNDMNNLVKEMNQWKIWSNLIIIDDLNRFQSCYVFHDPIIECYYSKDVCVIDDTSCTNFYGFPLLLLISEDGNARNQVLSYAILSSRMKTSFVNYFVELKNRVGDIRLFVSDINKTQISAIKEIFPNAFIIYCSVHIGRNIYSKVGAKLFDQYYKMRQKDISEEEFINLCKNYINNNPNTKSSKFLEQLLEEKEHWLPSYTIKYTHCDNDTTNRVEGFFGSLKNLLEHRIHSLANVVRAIYLRGERLRLASINEKKILISENIISSEDADEIRSFAVPIISSEYNDLNEIGALSVSFLNGCCINNLLYGLPCKHLLLNRIKEDRFPLLNLNDIPTRWRHCKATFQRHINNVEKKF